MRRHPWWVHAGIVAVVAAVAFWLLRPSDPELPEYFETPEFALLTQAGDTLRSDALEGDVWIAGFVYTSCPDICPIITARMAALRDSLRADGLLGDEVRLVSFTVDPERDTPPVLDEYAQRFGGAEPGSWAFVTGAPDDVHRLVREGFFIGASRATGAPVADTSPAGGHGGHETSGQGEEREAGGGRDVVPDTIPAGLREGVERELRARDTVVPPRTEAPSPGPAAGTAGDYLVTHSDYLLLVDRTGRVRGIYSGTDAGDVRRLLTEARGLARN